MTYSTSRYQTFRKDLQLSTRLCREIVHQPIIADPCMKIEARCADNSGTLEKEEVKSNRSDSHRLQLTSANWRTVQQENICSGHCNIRVPTSSRLLVESRRNTCVCCDNAYLTKWVCGSLYVVVINSWQERSRVDKTSSFFSLRYIFQMKCDLWCESSSSFRYLRDDWKWFQHKIATWLILPVAYACLKD